MPYKHFPVRELFGKAAKTTHPHAWLWEPLEGEVSFVLRTMFGAKGVYLDGRLQLCFIAQGEPWQGLLVCTEKRHHAALIRAVPSLAPHPVLAKWLYLPEAADDFERAAEWLVQCVKQRDVRIGVVGKPRGKRRK